MARCMVHCLAVPPKRIGSRSDLPLKIHIMYTMRGAGLVWPYVEQAMSGHVWPLESRRFQRPRSRPMFESPAAQSITFPRTRRADGALEVVVERNCLRKAQVLGGFQRSTAWCGFHWFPVFNGLLYIDFSLDCDGLCILVME